MTETLDPLDVQAHVVCTSARLRRAKRNISRASLLTSRPSRSQSRP